MIVLTNHSLEIFDQISPESQLAAQIGAKPFSGKRTELIKNYIFLFSVSKKLLPDRSMSEPKAPNFTPRILSYRKFAYQEGNENDTHFLCKNGTVTVSRD